MAYPQQRSSQRPRPGILINDTILGQRRVFLQVLEEQRDAILQQLDALLAKKVVHMGGLPACTEYLWSRHELTASRLVRAGLALTRQHCLLYLAVQLHAPFWLTHQFHTNTILFTLYQ